MHSASYRVVQTPAIVTQYQVPVQVLTPSLPSNLMDIAATLLAEFVITLRLHVLDRWVLYPTVATTTLVVSACYFGMFMGLPKGLSH
jgi:hypothetical protein